MTKGTCWAKVMANSQKINPVALAIIELCLSEGISSNRRIQTNVLIEHTLYAKHSNRMVTPTVRITEF